MPVFGSEIPDGPDGECFLIAPIGDPGTPTRERSDGIRDFIVGRAAEQLRLRVIRADDITDGGHITLQVIEHVLSARLVVADLTGSNPNVFYELGLRHAAQKPCVLISEDGGGDRPFDIAQLRTISFDHTNLASAHACADAIVSHANTSLSGTLDSPVASAIHLATLQAGSPSEQVLGELVERVEALASDQRTLAASVTLALIHLPPTNAGEDSVLQRALAGANPAIRRAAERRLMELRQQNAADPEEGAIWQAAERIEAIVSDSNADRADDADDRA